MSSCTHCGTPFSPSGGLADFCCRGCEFVHSLIHEKGFDRFYDLRQNSSLRPARSIPFDCHDFTWLEETVTAAEEKASPVSHADFSLEGLSCVGCVWLIESLFDRHPGAFDASARPATGRLTLRWQTGKADLPAFARELATFGYTLAKPRAGGKNGESQALVGKLGLCAAFALNAMVFTLPRYLGMPADFAFAGIFELVTLLTATLSMLVGGSYFIKKAWLAAKARTIHIDLPIALGILAAYLGSLFGWAAGIGGLLYFDFVSTFVFLMLGGRYLQLATVEKNRQRLQTARPVAENFASPDRDTPLPLDQIAPGSRLFTAPGQSLPVGGFLETGAADFSLEWITGESGAQTFRAGRMVPAGAIFLGNSPVVFKAAESWENSLLARLLGPGPETTRHPALERVLKIYLLTIITIGLAAFALWWTAAGMAPALQVMISIFVVSCPCALGLALPLADEFAAARMQRAGVHIRDHLLWPRLRKLRTVIFDKTGTLTLERPVLTNPEILATLPDPAIRALARLVDGNLHPVSRTLSETLATRFEKPPPNPLDAEIEDHPGMGRATTIGIERWTLGRPGWASGKPADATDHDAELACNGKVVARFNFRETLRPGAVESLAALRHSGLRLLILSGDRPEKVALAATALGIPPEDAHGGLTPEEKEARVKEIDRSDTLYLGDGANDSLAFDAACVRGTPVVDRTLLESKADFYFFGNGVQFLPGLLKTAALRRRTVRATFFFTALYNLGAVGLALAGLMNPLAAAIVMPLSAVASLGIVAGGLRNFDQLPKAQT